MHFANLKQSQFVDSFAVVLDTQYTEMNGEGEFLIGGMGESSTIMMGKQSDDNYLFVNRVILLQGHDHLQGYPFKLGLAFCSSNAPWLLPYDGTDLPSCDSRKYH